MTYTKPVVKLSNGDILPYVKDKEYAYTVEKVWDMAHIRPMNESERKRAIEREKANSLKKCVSCGIPSANDWCEFCLNEE